MNKLAELQTMADSLGMKVNVDKTDSKETYTIVKDVSEIAKGSFETVKIKLEDLMHMKNIESKIKELINAGKTDQEIFKIIAEEKDEDDEDGPLEIAEKKAAKKIVDSYVDKIKESIELESRDIITEYEIDKNKEDIAENIAFEIASLMRKEFENIARYGLEGKKKIKAEDDEDAETKMDKDEDEKLNEEELHEEEKDKLHEEVAQVIKKKLKELRKRGIKEDTIDEIMEDLFEGSGPSWESEED